MKEWYLSRRVWIAMYVYRFGIIYISYSVVAPPVFVSGLVSPDICPFHCDGAVCSVVLNKASEDVVSDIVAAFCRRSGARSSQHRLLDSLGLATVCLCAASQAPAERTLHAARLCEVQRRRKKVGLVGHGCLAFAMEDRAGWVAASLAAWAGFAWLRVCLPPPSPPPPASYFPAPLNTPASAGRIRSAVRSAERNRLSCPPRPPHLLITILDGSIVLSSIFSYSIRPACAFPTFSGYGGVLACGDAQSPLGQAHPSAALITRRRQQQQPDIDDEHTDTVIMVATCTMAASLHSKAFTHGPPTPSAHANEADMGLSSLAVPPPATGPGALSVEHLTGSVVKALHPLIQEARTAPVDIRPVAGECQGILLHRTYRGRYGVSQRSRKTLPGGPRL
ncbi:hypothetical protein KC346_g54 [Hortaea werneckii]|nr:hypothetical protein KC346_g54 [Hortaea werneckii]